MFQERRVVQGLQEKVAVEVLEALWLSSGLWENQLELVSRLQHQARSGLGLTQIQSMPGGGSCVPLVSIATSNPPS